MTTDLTKARRELSAAIALHEKHMNGTAPTTGPAGAKSQMAMMEMMRRALAALGDDSLESRLQMVMRRKP